MDELSKEVNLFIKKNSIPNRDGDAFLVCKALRWNFGLNLGEAKAYYDAFMLKQGNTPEGRGLYQKKRSAK